MASRVVKVSIAALAAAAVYLALWPVPVEPVAWRAPPAPPLPPDARLRGVERLLAGVALGPEAVAIDPRGRPCTGTRDGRILCLDPASGAVERLAETGGRPLGLAFDRSGRLYVCDARKGLLAVSPSGAVETLATAHGGVPFGLADDVDVGPDGTVYFTDASSRFGLGQTREDVLEHAGRGRLLAYHPATRETELLLSGLDFANGVAVAGDGSFVLVNETGAYRIRRYWLSGPRRGTAEPFAENLPGLPDNVTWSAARKVFWVALFSPRVPALDVLAPYPLLRKVVLRLPRAVQPEPAPHALAVAVDEGGRVVEVLQDASPGAFAPVTSVREHGGYLWLGSLERDALGRLPAPAARRSPRAVSGGAAPRGRGRRTAASRRPIRRGRARRPAPSRRSRCAPGRRPTAAGSRRAPSRPRRAPGPRAAGTRGGAARAPSAGLRGGEERRRRAVRGQARDADALPPARLPREERHVRPLHREHAGEEGEERAVGLAVHRRRRELDLEPAVVLARDPRAGGARLDEQLEHGAAHAVACPSRRHGARTPSTTIFARSAFPIIRSRSMTSVAPASTASTRPPASAMTPTVSGPTAGRSKRRS